MKHRSGPLALRVACAAVVLAVALLQPWALRAQGLPWADRALEPQRRAELLLRALTVPEKFQQLTGAPGIIPEIPECYGARHVPGIPRLGVPTFRITNGPVGVGQGDCVPPDTPRLPFGALMSTVSPRATQLPSAMAVAASFDTAVARRFGDVIGRETRDLGLHVLEGPGLNLARVPQGGRNFEYFGEDPFLTGTMAVAEIRALQAHGVIAMAKHFVANEQETARSTSNSLVDDRVLHELYLLPFEMAVKDGGVASIMCSYNRVNGVYACEDRHHLTEVLRGQWGFEGYVQSDFFAVRSVAPTLRAGMDHEMPGLITPAGSPIRTYLTPEELQAAIDRGELAIVDVDTALVRRFRQMFRLGIMDRPLELTPIDTASHARLAREVGEESAVLLKNAGTLLPLDAKAIRSVALIGQAPYATQAVAGCCGGSSDVIPLTTVTPLEGFQRTLAQLGSGTTTSLTVVDSTMADLADAVAAARAADVAIVLVGTLSEEGRDLPTIALPHDQDALVRAVADANPRTVVVLKDNASAILPWIEEVPAVLEAWFPGQMDGDIIARLLFGLATPSGKLPVTFPRAERDLPVGTPRQWPGVDSAGTPAKVVDPTATMGLAAGGGPYMVEYSERLEIGYRWFDARGIDPLFPFGHGLSYTTFQLSDLEVTPRVSDGTQSIRVRVTVENTGVRRGAEVPQVYLGLPASTGEPPKRLVGFEKVWLEPGEQRRVEITIDPGASHHPLSTWDAAGQGWVTADGAYSVYVGRSSADLPLRDTVTIRSP